jgi:Xaa-Pro aminopeptidase
MRVALRARGLAGAFLTRPEYGMYLTGAAAGPLLISEADVVRFDGAGGVATRVFASAEPAEVTAALQDCGLTGRAIGVEMPSLPLDLGRMLALRASLVDATAALTASRMVLDSDERARLREHVTLIERGLRAAAAVAAEGVTEIAVACAAVTRVSETAGRMISFAGNLGAGAENLNPDSVPSLRRWRQGETLFLDFYPDLGGYSADLTRSFSLGPPRLEVKRLHGILEESLTAALGVIRHGVAASAVDAAVRHVFADRGVLRFFPHHSGHGLGLFSPAPPHLVPGDETVLEAGMALAVEPGLYVPGIGGLRLEVNLLVTEDGSETLGTLPPELIVCGRT